jgi:uncharacterized SAM-binding protein YcdF (DUF218 family)
MPGGGVTVGLWKPSEVEIMQATLAVLCDKEAYVPDVVFLHGSPARDDELDERLVYEACELYGFKTIFVLNGLTQKECLKLGLAYNGYEEWQEYLLNSGVGKEDIILLEPSKHTAAESMNLLLLAKENKWNNIVIMSYPYHQLRCFLQIIALMDEVRFYPNVYNRTFSGLDWTREMFKPVLGGGRAVDGTLKDHIAAEYERIVKYAQRGDSSFTRHATIPEMFEYIRSRDAKALRQKA